MSMGVWLLMGVGTFILLPLMLHFVWGATISVANISLNLSLSSLSLLFLSAVALISMTVMLWSWFYMGGSMSMGFFYFFLLSFILSMMLLLVSDSLLSIFLGWEGLGVTSFLLVIFYQNWMSYGGGLLTMLTNRVGDGMLLLCFSYWILTDAVLMQFQHGSMAIFLLFLAVSFTKSAQVPFTSWLPAAMAAPTPVSALVHSSTLVTAGVWLMIRFMQSFLVSLLLWSFFGGLTLLVASLSAISESDAKKVVALSTLSQLGLMFIALSMGGKFICLMHVLTHAFAKANLFLGVGSILHFRFSQQDSRYISSSLEEHNIFVSMVISILSLTGVAFYSGFFSKEFILLGETSMLSSFLAFFLFLGIITLTMSYCLLFISVLTKSTTSYSLSSASKSAFYEKSILPLAAITVMMGFYYSWNINCFNVTLTALSGAYWMVLVTSLYLISLSSKYWLTLFLSQKSLIVFLTYKFNALTKAIGHSLASLIEPFYLVMGLFSSSSIISQLNRIVIFTLFASMIMMAL